MRTKVLITMAVLAIAALSAAGAQAGSGRCNGGTPVGGGISVRNDGDPTSGAGWAAVCADGSTVPVAGHVEIGGDANAQEGYVYADGDPSNSSLTSCADGFVRVELGAGGPVFFSGPDGNVTDTNPNQGGNQAAQPKSADQFAQDLAADCQ